MKKFLLGILAASVIFAAPVFSADKAAKPKIGLSISTLNNPFFVSLKKGAQAAAKKAGAQLFIADAGDDVVKQTNDMEDLIAKKVSVIIVNPVDSSAIAGAVTEAKKAGIKVIAVDRAVIGETVACQIASDNVAGAKMAGEYLLKLAGSGAKVAELQGVLGASATIDRGKGFHQAVDGKVKIVASQTANFNRAEGLTVCENILQGNGDLTAIFAHNDEMALGAVEACEAAGKKVIIVGFDATDDAVKAVKAKRMAATVAQQPSLMGETAVNVAMDLIAGKSVAKDMPVAVSLITK